MDAWSERDLEAILEHYADDIEVRSPRVAERFGIPDGILRGKDRLREYCALGLAKPDLHFELVEVLEGPGTMTVVYRRETGALVADCSELDSAGRITRMIATYGAPSK
ncbi:MAG: nuclear transport factor 2 family protein [Dehalococcoidia bacterium]|nr:nuclear transport factor 2 family protein [Dehalococcoidia bacterium]